MTTEERIAALERQVDELLDLREPYRGEYAAFDAMARLPIAAILEQRALRLMLREEIREAAWKMAVDLTRPAEPIASRKAPPPNPDVNLDPMTRG